MSDEFFREVNEEVRRDKAHQFWKENGIWIIGISVAIVLGTAGGVGWKHYKTTQNARHSAQLIAASEQDTLEAQLESFDALAKDAGGSASGSLAGLRAASLKAEQGETQAAFDEYLMIAEKADTPALRNLAIVSAANLAAGSEIKFSLTPNIAKDDPFYHSWQEARGWLLVKQDKPLEAIKLFGSLAEDETTPIALRQRMQALVPAMIAEQPAEAFKQGDAGPVEKD